MIDRIRRLLSDTPVIDGHNDLLWELRVLAGYDFDTIDVSRDQRPAGLHTDLPRLRAGGVGAQFWSVWVPCWYDPARQVTATLEQIDAAYRMIERYQDHMQLAASAAEVAHAVGRGRIAALLGVEGGHCIQESLGVLRMMYALGVRYMTLTHTENTSWADSATDKPAVGGLNDFGREVVREMNLLGMLVDLSHVAATTMHAALDVSTAPAFFSHSSARALCDHPRNVPDDVLTRVRDSNGVVMVTFVPGFLNEECRVWMDTLIEAEDRTGAEYPHGSREWRAAMHRWVSDHPRPPCGVSDVADHIDHVREVAGAAHVGIGSDFDGFLSPPEGLTDVSGYPALLVELARRGWSDAELAGLTYRNVLRVMRDAEATAESA
ncbi:MAG TPA: dipeptidase [Micromonosporaceae bacterium]|nr:dipeptidase [Micromonosporaceae bacterium]